MSWNYRVVQDKHGTYTIREVYYDIPETDGMMWSEHPRFPMGETIAELANDLKLMFFALDRTILIDEGDKLVDGRPLTSEEKDELLRIAELLDIEDGDIP